MVGVVAVHFGLDFPAMHYPETCPAQSRLMATDPIDPLPASSRRQLILAAQLAFLPTGILTTLLGPMLPLLIVRWSLNDAQAGNLFLVQFLSSLVGVQLSGVLPLATRISSVVSVGLLLMACGTATLYMGSVRARDRICRRLWPGAGLDYSDRQSADCRNQSSLAQRRGEPAEFLLGHRRGALFGNGRVGCRAPGTAIFSGSGFTAPRVAGVRRAWSSVSARGHFQGSRVQLATEFLRSPAIWLFAAVFFLYPGAETAVGGWIGSYVSRLGRA